MWNKNDNLVKENSQFSEKSDKKWQTSKRRITN